VAWTTDAGFPWGRHRGEPLVQIPLPYLRWALDASAVGAALRRRIREELARRGYLVPDPPAPPGVPLLPAPDDLKTLRGE
jgi:hypothetical protein